MREWISYPDSEVIKLALKEMNLPASRAAGTFDERAWKVWKYVAENIEYVSDKKAFGMPDFWLFPAETLTLRRGDCEDSSFLLATLMIASGISEHCVRVVIGRVFTRNTAYGHCWVVYQNESGTWCLLESTLNSIPQRLPPADPFTEPGSGDRYEPQLCFNRNHMWSIAPSEIRLSEYINSREISGGYRPRSPEI